MTVEGGGARRVGYAVVWGLTGVGCGVRGLECGMKFEGCGVKGVGYAVRGDGSKRVRGVGGLKGVE